MKEKIETYLNQFEDYDIRETRDARYVDQKCTPDVVSFIADCILCTSCAKQAFSCNNLWEENYFINNCRVIFHKPSPANPKARNEYNKILCQPLKLLAYAHLLDVQMIGKTMFFSVRNKDILEYIAARERNAYNFLLIFFTKVLNESGIYRIFEEYETAVSRAYGNITLIKGARATIYEKYHRFISGNTPSQSKKDVDRIFHKVFNILCYNKNLPGSRSKIIDWYDLMYNKINWRDLGNHKKKELTRQEAECDPEKEINEKFYMQYQISRACRLVHNIQGGKSEVSDELSMGIATEVHHIFSKSQYPEISTAFENLILLTSSQHRQKAHPNSNFSLIDVDYQLLCLLSKSRTIENYVNTIGKGFYSKDGFIMVINTGLSESQINDHDISFDDIRKYLAGYYNEHI